MNKLPRCANCGEELVRNTANLVVHFETASIRCFENQKYPRARLKKKDRITIRSVMT